MFSQLLQDVFPYFSSNAVFIFTILSLSWLLWRIWRFTIFPALYPREPKAMPYLIPGVGHAISFFKDSEGVFTRSRKYFGNTREPFAVTVMGQQLYVVTSSADVSAVYRNTTTLSFDEFVRDMMLSIGGSEDGVRKMWESPRYETSKDGNSNRLHKILAHAGEDYYRQQLQPGDLLEALWTRAQDLISTSLEWNNISSKCMLSSQDDSKTLSLLGWCRETLLESVTTAVFGEKLSQLNPDLMKTFVTFDDDSWKMNYKLPRFLCEEMHTARETILATFQKYFALPPHERGGESWLVRTIETEMRKIEVPESDIAALFAMPFWVINSNAYKFCFWVMAYILHSPTLHSSILSEITPAISHHDLSNLSTRLENCTHLVAVYNELLRFKTASASIRSVAAPTELGSVTLSPGAKVLLPYRQLHFDESVFGENVDVFDEGRFLGNADLSKSPSFRPFGGGTTYCAGRFVAKREVLAFVALALSRFEIEVVGGGRFPECDVKKPCLGVLPPKAGEDMKVRVRKREMKV